MSNLNDKLTELTRTKDYTRRINPQDIQENTAMGILAYISWLVVIPLFGAKGSKFARFHCNQGLVLAIAELAAVVVLGILSKIPLIGWIFSVVEGLIWLVCVVLAVIGILNAANGRAKELPIVGGFRILK